MKPVRIFYHVDREPRSYIETCLDDRNIPFEVVCLDNHIPVPMDIDNCAGLVFMGGAGDVNQPTEYMKQELSLIAKAAEARLPIMGVCLGAQLISQALGGVVCKNESLEVGWYPVQQTVASLQQPWFRDLPGEFEVFQWHEHIYAMPPGAVALASNSCFSQQAFSMENILAMQFHLEMTGELIEFLIDNYGSDIEMESACIQQADRIRAQMDEHLEQLHMVADAVYGRWLQCVYDFAEA